MSIIFAMSSREISACVRSAASFEVVLSIYSSFCACVGSQHLLFRIIKRRPPQINLRANTGFCESFKFKNQNSTQFVQYYFTNCYRICQYVPLKRQCQVVVDFCAQNKSGFAQLRDVVTNNFTAPNHFCQLCRVIGKVAVAESSSQRLQSNFEN